jgi:uncharacterized Fe-S radical SAM superfamily protein PflX
VALKIMPFLCLRIKDIGKTSLIWDHNTKQKEVVSFVLLPNYLQRKSPIVQWIGSYLGSSAALNIMAKGRLPALPEV